MFDRVMVIVLSVSAFFLLSCGATPADINNRGREAYLEGDYATALQLYQEAQKDSPGSGEPYLGSANALYRMGQYESALEEYDESINYATGELRARSFFNRGNASFQQQRYGEAVEAYEEALRINPDDGDAKHNLELALRQLSSSEQEQEQGGQQAEEQEQEQGEQQAEEQEQEQGEQQAEEQEQEQGEQQAEEQVRQLLESVAESAQTLQQRRGQVLVSPEPPSEFDW